MSRQVWFAISLCLILIFFFSRLYDLLHFPAFIDEIEHIDWAKDSYDWHPFTGAANGKLFALWWMALFDLRTSSALFIVRAATVLFQCLSIATLLSLGRFFAGKWGGYLAASFYILSPYGLFYDRLGLVDPYILVFGLASFWFSIRYRKTKHFGDAILSGAMIVGAILAKASGVMLWIIPLLTYSLLDNISLRNRIKAIAYSYSAMILIWLPIYFFLAWRNFSYFSTATSVVGAGVDNHIIQRVLENLFGQEGIFYIDALYFSLPLMLLVLLTSLFYLWRNWRHALLLVSVLALPLGGLLAFAEKMSPRYFHYHVPFAFLLTAVSILSLAVYLERNFTLPRYVLPSGILLIWGFAFAIPFHWQYFHDPSQLNLPRLDHLEYVQSDASGFGIVDAANYLLNLQSETGEQFYLFGVLPNCASLFYLPQHQAMQIECASLKLDGSHQDGVEAHLETLRSQVESDIVLWLVFENTDYTSIDTLENWLELEMSFPRPSGLTSIELYRVERN